MRSRRARCRGRCVTAELDQRSLDLTHARPLHRGRDGPIASDHERAVRHATVGTRGGLADRVDQYLDAARHLGTESARGRKALRVGGRRVESRELLDASRRQQLVRADHPVVIEIERVEHVVGTDELRPCDRVVTVFVHRRDGVGERG